MVLIATTRLRCRSKARYTNPIPPRPITSTISYSPILVILGAVMECETVCRLNAPGFGQRQKRACLASRCGGCSGRYIELVLQEVLRFLAPRLFRFGRGIQVKNVSLCRVIHIALSYVLAGLSQD